jgi:hypothetical protein
VVDTFKCRKEKKDKFEEPKDLKLEYAGDKEVE